MCAARDRADDGGDKVMVLLDEWMKHDASETMVATTATNRHGTLTVIIVVDFSSLL